MLQFSDNYILRVCLNKDKEYICKLLIIGSVFVQRTSKKWPNFFGQPDIRFVFFSLEELPRKLYQTSNFPFKFRGE